MNEFLIRTLITRGQNHELRCEDDLYIFENDRYIVSAVFDGCSSGTDSHFASTYHKNLLSQAVDAYIDEQPYFQPNDFCKYFLYDIYKHLTKIEYIKGEEMLSTIVLMVIDKYEDEYCITFAGDGVCSVNGHITTIHDTNGDSVWYLSNVHKGGWLIRDDFEQYYKQCIKISGNHIEDIIISTDGIDTFKDKYGVILKEPPITTFFKDKRFLGAVNMLKRAYNIFTSGNSELYNIQNKNQDDFTMIRIIKKETDEKI